jgi:riboflavin kinase / FMN adenylyltransferase
MRFSSHQVKGKGRGKLLGFPTINLEIPKSLELKDGIYAIKVFNSGKEFLGAMHYGPIPVFLEDDKTLEFFLIDTKEEDIPKSKEFEVEIIKFLRPVMKFDSKEELSQQMSRDVESTRKLSDKN